jgi:hypothetical protein
VARQLRRRQRPPDVRVRRPRAEAQRPRLRVLVRRRSRRLVEDAVDRLPVV